MVTRPLVERELPANVHVFRRIADPLGPLQFGEQQEPEQPGAGSRPARASRRSRSRRSTCPEARRSSGGGPPLGRGNERPEVRTAGETKCTVSLSTRPAGIVTCGSPLDLGTEVHRSADLDELAVDTHGPSKEVDPVEREAREFPQRRADVGSGQEGRLAHVGGLLSNTRAPFLGLAHGPR
jgi:hypothetical protein